MFLLALIAFVAAQTPALAQLDIGSGTNAIATLSGNVQQGGNVMLPILLGLLGVFLAIGVVKKFSRKAGVSS